MLLAGPLSAWSGLLGADFVQLAVAKKTATGNTPAEVFGGEEVTGRSTVMVVVVGPKLTEGPGAVHSCDSCDGGPSCQAGAGAS